MNDRVVSPPEHDIAFVWWGQLEYGVALARMLELQQRRIQGDQQRDCIVYLEHEPVVTYGRATKAGDLAREPHTLPVVPVNRGGQATCHMPGQLIGYFLIDLANLRSAEEVALRCDLHQFIRSMEQGIIEFLSCHLGLNAGRKPGQTGVWVDSVDCGAGVPPARFPDGYPRKIASIGISVRKWVTAHGFALNLWPDLSAFEAIVPCGDPNSVMTSAEAECAWEGADPVPANCFRRLRETPIEQIAKLMHKHMIHALNEIRAGETPAPHIGVDFGEPGCSGGFHNRILAPCP